jgi:long-chain fatty acid transport protein
MKKFSFILLVGGSVFAANGGLLTGISPTSQGMGGTGTALWMSAADAIYKNPALLSRVPGKAGQVGLELGATVFKQNASVEPSDPSMAGTAFATAGEKKSQNGVDPLPYLAGTYKVNDQLGIGFVGMVYGGASADYSGEASVSKVFSKAMYSRLALGAGYEVTPGVSLGVAPYLTYSTLKLNALTTREDAKGASAFGVTFGATAKPLDNLQVGVSYTIKNKYTYKAVIDLSQLNGTAATPNDIHAGEPAILNAGVAYEMSGWKFSADYWRIFWSKTEGQGSLGWMDQSVFGVGANYAMNDWDFSAGFNYGKSPIDVTETSTTLSGVTATNQTISLMNIAAFPGISEAHLGGGAGYKVSSSVRAELSFVYTFSKTLKRTATTGGASPTTGTVGANNYAYTGKVSQWALGLGLSYLF